MERRGFLKSLGILIGASVLPNIPDFNIESKQERKSHKLIGVNDNFVNHLNIQRKTYKVTGGVSYEEFWYNKNGIK